MKLGLQHLTGGTLLAGRTTKTEIIKQVATSNSASQATHDLLEMPCSSPLYTVGDEFGRRGDIREFLIADGKDNGFYRSYNKTYILSRCENPSTPLEPSTTIGQVFHRDIDLFLRF